ncbi:hypothetical protein PC129_g7909 [Phytophthora cactorum]|uniref:Uncharacterized protein n=1 Tax=Phytophthora cactorum TaxID=29920 RepID=A0A329SD76_9STRA|nr:hypothetical protein Pcac1_g8631 [Phytophthora cactorum]KAG3024869.1 hypothetical protein PC120_g6805 [Phytophthora cactorum]KAG3221353.1 hypothetical protein PC129_g7909 [Phytophthora cactorum]KAG4058231.1 hypothetical protein PC123_g6773 [Phytophthora cactorum]RAW34561.1 hypothetical protein PC110_g9133 [Phytophthora cactorum]
MKDARPQRWSAIDGHLTIIRWLFKNRDEGNTSAAMMLLLLVTKILMS